MSTCDISKKRKDYIDIWTFYEQIPRTSRTAHVYRKFNLFHSFYRYPDALYTQCRHTEHLHEEVWYMNIKVAAYVKA